MNVELANAYWTSAGPVEVHVGREWSLFPFADRCAEAAKAGFKGIGLWHADIEHQLESSIARRDAARRSTTTGSRCMELEFLWDWMVDEGEEARTAADRLAPDAVRGGRGARRAPHQGGQHPRRRVRDAASCNERYAELCADAAQHTSAKVLYEFMPFDVNVNSIELALDGDGGHRQHRRGDRHLAHGQARHHARRPPQVPARAARLDRAERRPVRGHGGHARRGRSTAASCPARASSTSAATCEWGSTWATASPGASRCSRRICARCRSTRCTGAPTRARWRSSSPLRA